MNLCSAVRCGLVWHGGGSFSSARPHVQPGRAIETDRLSERLDPGGRAGHHFARAYFYLPSRGYF